MVGTPKPPLRIQRLRKREHRKRLGWGYPQSTGVEPRKIDPTVADDHPVPLEMSKVGTSEQPHGDHPRGIASESPSYKDQVLRAFYFGACPGGFSLVGGTIPLIRR